jgi:hypothetical protein
MLSRFRRSSGPEFLVVRRLQFRLRPHFYDVILGWVAENFPEFAPLFRIRHLPCHVAPGANVALHIPWLQDPVQRWSQRRYAQANRLAAECDALRIPIVNRVDRLINASKSVGSRLMAEAGVRTPRIVPISDPEEFKDTLLGIDPPLFVRDDWRHGGEMLRADTLEEARRLPVDRFERPVAVELIDIPSREDGIYRKYRYIAAGELGVTHHLQMSRHWIARGDNREKTEVSRDEELSYIASPDPNHAVLQRARAALGLDFLAFDYSYDYDGRIVVWEANPYPYIGFSTRKLVYRNVALHRTVAAMLAMYLTHANLPVPDVLRARFSYDRA